jgi:hypothetical protein
MSDRRDRTVAKGPTAHAQRKGEVGRDIKKGKGKKARGGLSERRDAYDTVK